MYSNKWGNLHHRLYRSAESCVSQPFYEEGWNRRKSLARRKHKAHLCVRFQCKTVTINVRMARRREERLRVMEPYNADGKRLTEVNALNHLLLSYQMYVV